MLLMCACLAVGSGCASASGQRFARLAVPQDKSVIYIYRNSSMVGGGCTVGLFANDRYITQVHNGGYFAYVCDPGSIKFKRLVGYQPILLGAYLVSKLAERPEPLYVLDAVAGEEFFLRLKVGFGISLKPVPRAKALADMEGMRMFEDKREKPTTVISTTTTK